MISTSSATAAPDQQQQTYYYYYFKQKRPLQLDVKKMALYRGGFEKQSLPQGLPDLGIVPADERAIPVASWSIAAVPAALQTYLVIRNLTA